MGSNAGADLPVQPNVPSGLQLSSAIAAASVPRPRGIKDPANCGPDCDVPSPSGRERYTDLSNFEDWLELHKGRHSTVWSARSIITGEVVVVKAYSKLKLKPRQLLNVQREVYLLRMFAEASCLGVVHLLSTFQDPNAVYLIFEACMRGDLYQLLVKQKGCFSEEFVASKVLVPLLTTLDQLHQLNVVHRDIKPENIFLSLDGGLQLGDFGLAAHKLHDRLVERVGTLDYMAPEVLAMPTPDEVAAGRRKPLVPYTEKVDIWAVGVLTYELFAGQPPFEVEDPKQTAQLIMNAPVTTFPAQLSPSCIDFIEQALNKQAELRPSAQELLHHPWLQPYTPDVCLDTSPTSKPSQQVLHASWTGSQGLRTLMDSFMLDCMALMSSKHSSVKDAVTVPRKALSLGDDPCLAIEDSQSLSSPKARTPGQLSADGSHAYFHQSLADFKRSHTAHSLPAKLDALDCTLVGPGALAAPAAEPASRPTALQLHLGHGKGHTRHEPACDVSPAPHVHQQQALQGLGTCFQGPPAEQTLASVQFATGHAGDGNPAAAASQPQASAALPAAAAAAAAAMASPPALSAAPQAAPAQQAWQQPTTVVAKRTAGKSRFAK